MVFNLDNIESRRFRIKKGSYYKFKFSMDNVDYFYKENEGVERADIGEVFSSYFLSHFPNVQFVDYDFATYKGKKGCISRSFVDNSVKYEKVDYRIANFFV